jgi:hypothetical protein
MNLANYKKKPLYLTLLCGGAFLLMIAVGRGFGASESLILEPIDCVSPTTEQLFTRCAPWNYALSVERERGLSWEVDDSFLIEGHTVPTVLVLHGGGYRMFTSSPQRGVIAMHGSDDGIEWRELSSRLTADELPDQCGGVLLDVSVRYLEDGQYLLQAETWNRPEGVMNIGHAEIEDASESENPVTLCGWRSVDGDNWTPLMSALFEPDDSSWPSGFEALGVGPDAALYYVDTYPNLDAIRLAFVRGDGAGRAGSRTPLLQRSHVDPDPVRIVDGGVRLYHTHSALTGELGASDSQDGVNFVGDHGLAGLSGQTCYTPPERPSPEDSCMFDPFYLRLSSGRMALYFGLFETTADGTERKGIGRAFAVD